MQTHFNGTPEDHSHFTSQDQFLCEIGLCPYRMQDDYKPEVWRYRFWRLIHDCLERAWHWVYMRKLRQYHADRLHMDALEERHAMLARHELYQFEYLWLLHMSSNCLHCPMSTCSVSGTCETHELRKSA